MRLNYEVDCAVIKLKISLIVKITKQQLFRKQF